MGSRVRNTRILQSLARSFELTIVTVVHDRSRLLDPGPLAELGRWVPIIAPHQRSLPAKLAWHLRWRTMGKREGVHRETFFQSFPIVAETVAKLIEDERPDIVHVAYWYALRHLPEFARPPLWVLDTHDVQFERHSRLWGRQSAMEKDQEVRELRRYDRVIAITDHDREVFAAELAGGPPVHVVGMGLELSDWDPAAVEPADPRPKRVTFYGNMTNESNQRGARHLLDDLLPAVRQTHPDVSPLLLGAGTPQELRDEAENHGAVVTGFVEDVRPWLASSSVLALSLRSGSGQRGRVLEALALGIPVVGYVDALEGLEFSDGEGTIPVRSEEAFAEAVTRLLSDPAEAERIGCVGRRCVQERYGWSATYGRFPELYGEWLESPPRG